MKILFIADNFVPEVNAPSNRTYEHCREWVAKGESVTVITGAPNFPQGKVYPGYRNRLHQREVLNGIEVVRVWTYMAKNAGFVRRIADYLSFTLSSFIAGLFYKCDLVVVTSPQFFAVLSAWLLAMLKRKPWVFEVRDLWPESVAAVGAVRRSVLLKAFEKLELFLYRHAARIVVVTESFKKNMVERGIEGAKITVVQNGIDREAFAPREADEKLRSELGLSGKRVVSYIGTHGMAHRLDFVLRCAKKLEGEAALHFLLIGDGAEKEALVLLAKSLGLTNVTMLPPVPRNEVSRYMSLTDVALVNLKKSDTFKAVIPSKIFESAAMQKPILLGVEGEARALVERYGAGMFFEPEDEEDFVCKLRLLLKDRALYEKCQAGCASLAKDFSRQRLAQLMLETLKQAVPRQPARRS